MLTISHKIEHECTHNDTQRIYDVDMSKSMYENLLIQWGWQQVGNTWESGYSQILSDGSTQYVCEIITIEENEPEQPETATTDKPSYRLYITEWENGHMTKDVETFPNMSQAKKRQSAVYRQYRANGYNTRQNTKGHGCPIYCYTPQDESKNELRKASNSIQVRIVTVWYETPFENRPIITLTNEYR